MLAAAVHTDEAVAVDGPVVSIPGGTAGAAVGTYGLCAADDFADAEPAGNSREEDTHAAAERSSLEEHDNLPRVVAVHKFARRECVAVEKNRNLVGVLGDVAAATAESDEPAEFAAAAADTGEPAEHNFAEGTQMAAVAARGGPTLALHNRRLSDRDCPYNSLGFRRNNFGDWEYLH